MYFFGVHRKLTIAKLWSISFSGHGIFLYIIPTYIIKSKFFLSFSSFYCSIRCKLWVNIILPILRSFSLSSVGTIIVVNVSSCIHFIYLCFVLQTSRKKYNCYFLYKKNSWPFFVSKVSIGIYIYTNIKWANKKWPGFSSNFWCRMVQ